MIRGTRIIAGEEAIRYTNLINILRDILINSGYSEVIIPSLWEQQTFVEKAGSGIIDQMYIFSDKKGRPICLITY